MTCNDIEVICFLCNQVLKSEKDYKIHLENDHSMKCVEEFLKYTQNESEMKNETVKSTKSNKSYNEEYDTLFEGKACFENQRKYIRFCFR